MSRVNPYGSIEKRTFEATLIHLLETEYRVVGSHRILKVLAEDVEQLVQQFYPSVERAQSGQLIWTCTANEGQKAQPGKRTEEYKAVTVVLPLVVQQDLEERQERGQRGEGAARTRNRHKQRVQRLVRAAAEQGGLLTIAELSVILGLSYEAVRGYLREVEEETGKALPLKGTVMDQGSRPTHKGAVIALYEQGMEPPDIARETAHNLKSVERYLADYERVRMLLKRRWTCKQISTMISRGEHVVEEYIAQARQYHPELFAPSGEES